MAGFKKASQIQLFARIGLYGPSGAGKTVTALRIAQGLGGNIAIIDSEHGSSGKAKRLNVINQDYDIWTLENLDIAAYTEAIVESARAGYRNLIIDSMSHAWQELVDENEDTAQRAFKGNSWAAWSKTGKKQKDFIEAILGYPGNIIATMRVKTEWVVEGGKPRRVGQAPVQGKGIEYEFDMLITLSPDHSAYFEKDRTSRYQDKSIPLIGEDFGVELAQWLREGKPVEMITAEQREGISELIVELNLSEEQIEAALKHRGLTAFEYATKEQADSIIDALSAKVRANRSTGIN